MSYQIIDVPQRSPEWLAARAGRLTGSRANDMLATIQKGEAKARIHLRAQLVCERLTGQSQDDPYTNNDMKRGEELEQPARELYEAKSGLLLATTGFLSHTELMAGCSLDGHVNNMVGIVDFKCPRAGNHLEYLRSEAIPTDYLRQLTHGLWITGAEWAEMVSYCPQFPEPLQLCIRRVERKNIDLVAYDAAVKAFLAEVDREVAAVMTMVDSADQWQRAKEAVA